MASGRSFDAVAHLFPEEYRTRLDFICDNGANVIHEGKQVSVTPLDRQTFEQLIRACEDIGGLRVLVCAGRGTYHLTADAEFSAEIAKYYKNHIPCDDLLSVDDVIYKLAVCDMKGTSSTPSPLLTQYSATGSTCRFPVHLDGRHGCRGQQGKRSQGARQAPRDLR